MDASECEGTNERKSDRVIENGAGRGAVNISTGLSFFFLFFSFFFFGVSRFFSGNRVFHSLWIIFLEKLSQWMGC